MAEKILRTVIQVRRDTTANWILNKDTVPKAGEPCLDTDLHMIKYGDGVTTYENLPFTGGTGGGDFSHYEGVREEGENDNAVINRVLGELEATPIDGDIFVIKTVISGDKVSYSAFVYDGEVWAAMDGNYNAENVYLASNLTITANIGVQEIDASGSKTLDTAGKNIKQVLDLIMAEEKNPSITQPSVSVSSSQVKAYEAGTNVTPSYTASLNPGKYEFGPETGITAQTWSVTLDSQTLTSNTGTFNQIQVTDNTNLRISATATYGDGSVPKTNLGNNYDAGKIVAGSKSGQTGAITGYRQIFYGVRTTDSPIDSAAIRALTPTNKAAAGMTINSLKAGSGAKQMVVAVPQKSGLIIKSANITSSLNADVTSSYVKQGPIQVEGANGYSAVAYDVFVYQPASIDPTEDHKIVIGK